MGGGTSVAVAMVSGLVLLLVTPVLAVLIVRLRRGRGGAPAKAAGRMVEVDDLFVPARRHQAEQQRVEETTRLDVGSGDGSPLDRYTDAAALRRRWGGAAPDRSSGVPRRTARKRRGRRRRPARP